MSEDRFIDRKYSAAIILLPVLILILIGSGFAVRHAYLALESHLIDKNEQRQCHAQCHYGDTGCADRCAKNHFCPAERE